MTDATVTLKMTPRHFDLVRRALASHESMARANGKRESAATPAERRDANAEALITRELIEKLS